MRDFLKRNSILSLRKPEATSAARAMGFNKVVVGNFQTLLEETIEKYRLTPDRIYNVDEMGCSTVAKHVSKIVATKGKKQVGIVTSAERGENVTIELCASAPGTYLPPLFVFPRKRIDPTIMAEAPKGSWSVCHPSGWMQSDIFFKWFKWFVRSVQPSKDEPVLLLLYGHTTHTKNVDVINFARKNHVVILCFPPHCTHRLQPLDISFMRSLSIHYATEVKNWMRSNAGQVVKPRQIPTLLGRAFEKAATPETAKNGFIKTGIWPFSRNVFTEDDFMPAEVTKRPEENPLMDTINKKKNNDSDQDHNQEQNPDHDHDPDQTQDQDKCTIFEETDSPPKDLSVESTPVDAFVPLEKPLESSVSFDSSDVFLSAKSHLSGEATHVEYSTPSEMTTRGSYNNSSMDMISDDIFLSAQSRLSIEATRVETLDDLSDFLSHASIHELGEDKSNPHPHCSHDLPCDNPSFGAGFSTILRKQPRRATVFSRPTIFSSSDDEEPAVKRVKQ